MTTPLSILLVDDEPLKAELLRANLQQVSRMDVRIAHSGAHALELLAHAPVDAVVTDLMMAGMDGIELVRRIHEIDAGLPVLILTANATLERAVEGVQAGAVDFLQHPVNLRALLTLLERAVAERPLREQLARRTSSGPKSIRDYLLGDHPRLEQVRRAAEQIAATPYARLLLTGESGTGKTHLARAIHELSGARGQFVQVNCAALSAHLLESELFGHEKGAFTDARTLKRGLIEVAQNGTLLLDEIGAMPLELQAKLLLFLESQEIRRVGGVQPIPVRTRIVAATNEDLAARVRERRFREDLFFRLEVATIEMPPLREMPSIIAPLAEHLLRQLCAAIPRPVPRLDATSFTHLPEYPWPGNTRELRNAVERALIFHSGGVFTVSPPNVRQKAPEPGTNGLVLPPGLTLDEVEKQYIAYSLEQNRQQVALTAEQLGISRKSLWQRCRRHGL